MASERSRILLCLIVCCVGVTTRSLEDYGFDSYDYESLYQRSITQRQSQPETLNIAMPEVRPTKHDTYFCTSLKIDNPQTYIVGYQPHAEMHTAHHMLLFGCEYPPSQDKFWNCGDMGVGVCGRNSREKIMYAWGRNAKVLELPKDVGFKVGDKDSRYLVLQVHYGHVDKFLNDKSIRDHSGVTLEVKHKRPHHLAAILVLTNRERAAIPPQKEAFNLDMGCQYTGKTIIHPFAFRVHAHSLGSVTTGYRIRNKKWELIGKGDPQRPQAFYAIDKNMDIRSGDILAGQCTYNTMKKQKTTYIGATMKDEMCNFYMMYYYDSSTPGSAAPGDYCREHFVSPADSIVLLPGSGKKMEMKRDEGTESL
uniref:peptidylglycine monooxygenase n=1 Tax=Calliactis parasitica TaxID=6114 RepID=O44398_CALPA|nr:peptidylglycine alpha-hydroxylating monooxygenase [Calliactis parasitica]